MSGALQDLLVFKGAGGWRRYYLWASLTLWSPLRLNLLSGFLEQDHLACSLSTTLYLGF